MSATKLTTKGQIVIPKPVRTRLRWRPGTRLSIEEKKDGSVVLRPLNFDPIEYASGLFKDGPDMIAALEEERRAERERDERKLRRR